LRAASRRLWAYIALFATFLVLAALLVVRGPQLLASGMAVPIFFFALVPVALASAAFLARALGAAAAEYEGTLWFGRIKLGGPVAVFAMVLVAGLWVIWKNPPPPPATVGVTVRVHGPNGPTDIVGGSGQVVLDLGQDRRIKSLSREGEAVFTEIPARFAGQTVSLGVLGLDGYAARPGPAPTLPANGVLLLALDRVKPSSLFRGTVLGRKGQPVPGALVDVDHGLVTTTTNERGEFEVEVPVAAGTAVSVLVAVAGRVGYRDNLTVPGAHTLRLRP